MNLFLTRIFLMTTRLMCDVMVDYTMLQRTVGINGRYMLQFLSVHDMLCTYKSEIFAIWTADIKGD